VLQMHVLVHSQSRCNDTTKPATCTS